MQLEDWLDDLCVRFIINLPPEELASVERICFQVEEAQWFYEDFVRPLDPSLPSLSLKQFSLRIFQHCPLFAQWSAQHHTTAFAEFLAYKQRVPVRGAIMLNEAMDEVVLVKGWKKGANWSFPRGKINKGENDLDCAVREVYEETGFDITSAGLVKPEREMKYIEVTMREQHMRLYVFKGVPRDTYFEPRTRKEISKIEWYKLTDLPTLKKKPHNEHDDHPALNANKFYMVAPFLHPLKKWIAQQRKKDGRYSGSALAVPPMLAEESATENEGLPHMKTLHHDAFSPPTLSNLPEVIPTQPQLPIEDPSLHLKELLKIGGRPAQSAPAVVIPNQAAQIPGTNVPKSNALLALLRNGTQDTRPQEAPGQQTQIHTLPKARTPSPLPDFRQTPQTGFQAPPPLSAAYPRQEPQNQQTLLQLFKNDSPARQPEALPQPIRQQNLPLHQQIEESHYALQATTSNPQSTIPPTNALPTLTHHTRALLDAFKAGQSSERGSSAPQTVLQPTRQALLDAFRSPNTAHVQQQYSMVDQGLPAASELPSGAYDRSWGPSKNANDAPTHSTNLLNLFRQPAEAVALRQGSVTPNQQVGPAELAAAPVYTPKAEAPPSQNEVLASLFKRDKPQPDAQRPRSPVAKAGQTGATISGPLNQPHFDGMLKSSPGADIDARRSPVPTHRTLFDHKQPTPMKILARPDGRQAQMPPPRSPRPAKGLASTSSPKKTAKPVEKPFQPQILRRPQASESFQRHSPSPSSLTLGASTQASRRPSNLTSTSPSPNLEHSARMSPGPIVSPRRVSEQSDSQKQSLLSLFGGSATATPGSGPQLMSKQVSTSGLASPTFPSHAVSPVTEDPISTRSRVGSLASIISIGPGPGQSLPSGVDGRPKVEKRQTTAEDKAFLLGYLGRIANQEG